MRIMLKNLERVECRRAFRGVGIAACLLFMSACGDSGTESSSSTQGGGKASTKSGKAICDSWIIGHTEYKTRAGAPENYDPEIIIGMLESDAKLKAHVASFKAGELSWYANDKGVSTACIVYGGSDKPSAMFRLPARVADTKPYDIRMLGKPTS